MNDVLEAARRIVAWDDSGRLADDEWLVEKNETAIIAICRALLGLREALEKAEHTLLIASRMLTEDHKMVLHGKRWGDATLVKLRAAIEKATKP